MNFGSERRVALVEKGWLCRPGGVPIQEGEAGSQGGEDSEYEVRRVSFGEESIGEGWNKFLRGEMAREHGVNVPGGGGEEGDLRSEWGGGGIPELGLWEGGGCLLSSKDDSEGSERKGGGMLLRRKGPFRENRFAD